MGIVYHTVADGIGDSGVTQGGVPLCGGELAGDDRRGAVVPVFEDFEEVATLAVLERGDEQVVKDEDVQLGEPSKHAAVAAVGPSNGKFLKQPRDARVQGSIPMATRGLGECGGEVALAAAGLSDADDVVAVADPAAIGQLTHDGLGHTAALSRPHILHRRIVGQFRCSEQP